MYRAKNLREDPSYTEIYDSVYNGKSNDKLFVAKLK